jgi:hypothetical protein
MPSFASIEADFLRITSEVAWATVATVDEEGRPRTRILHPYWESVDGRPVGWVGTSRSPLKSRHLAANPHVSLAYSSPKQETAHAECTAFWADARIRLGGHRALEGGARSAGSSPCCASTRGE